MSDSGGLPNEPPSSPAVSVTTGSRLHFGLLRTARPFGGLGMMIDAPITRVSVEPADKFEVVHHAARGNDDPVDRVRQIAQRVAIQRRMRELPARRITIHERPAAHFGLGSGTQLSMAVAESIVRSYAWELADESLARDIAGRGERSAVGIHGYFHGGLIFENASGDVASDVGGINPIDTRFAIPDHWRVAIFQPRQPVKTVSGEREHEHFVRTATFPQGTLDRLVTIAQNDLLPAVAAADFLRFAAAAERFNHHSGLLFEPVQGGAYNGKEITDLVETLRSLGAVGLGQSSWGPSVFSWFENETDADAFVAGLAPEFASSFVTKAKNSPRQINIAPPD